MDDRLEQHPMPLSEGDSVERSLIEAAFEQEASGDPAASISNRRHVEGGEDSRQTPAEIRDYDIIREIHQGGQGVVYEAIQETTNRRVAIKVLRHGPLANRRERARFEREARILARIDDPRIVTIHHTGQAYGGDYFVMDFVDGRPLDRFVASKALGVRETLSLIATICEAVETAHLKGIIHRDLKPSNILVDEQGEPHVLDFGLAKMEAEADDVTRARNMTITGQFVGSLPWASPEQADGTPDLIDLRTDVYSLGVLLYQLLTGQFPYDVVGKMREVLGHILDAEPIKPRTIRSDIDDEVETIVLKCLAKDPDRRYQSAGELARDIRHYLADEPIEAKRDSTVYVLRKQMHRHRVPLIVATGILFLIIASSVVAWTLYLRSQENLRDSYVAQAHSTRIGGRAGRRFDTLDALKKAANIRPSIELRNEAIAATALTDARIVRQWVVDGGASWSEAFFSPDLKHYALLDQGGELSLRRVAGDHELLHVEGNGVRKGVPTFSPDGKLVAVAIESAYAIWNLSDAGKDESAPLLEVPRQPKSSRVSGFSSDSKEFALSVESGIRFYDLESGGFRVIKRPKATVDRLTLHPRAPLIAAWSPIDTEALILDSATGDVIRTLSHPETVYGLTWSRDGTLLATGCGGNAAVYVWDVQTGQQKYKLTGHTGAPVRLDFNTEGDILMSSGWDSETLVWDLRTGRQILAMHGCGLKFDEGANRLAHVTIAGNRLTFKIVELKQGAVQTLIGYDPSEDHARKAYQVAIVPTGRILSIGRSDGVDIWDLAFAKRIGHLKIGTTQSVFFSHGGHELYTSGPNGAFRWPVKTKGNRIRIGPPETLWDKMEPRATGLASLSGNDAKLAISAGASRVVVLDLNAADKPTYVGTHSRLHFVALNHDGSRLATSTWHGDGVKVWDVFGGKLVYKLPTASATRVEFSPDGGQLITSNGAENCIWDAKTGRRLHRLPRTGLPGVPGTIEFSPDGTILAMSGQRWTVRLYETSTMRPLGIFTAPDALPIYRFGVAFTPDGTRLVTSTERAMTVNTWDLRAIREQLATMNLDW
ncbi:MAG TPA: hypothetical protein ENI79_05400, partial [Rhodospirillales bacterium]|nr:hypothetical protein [Rhodospirillales bacterium]